MIKPNPFTPKSGLDPKVFINRDKEIKFFIRRINEAKQRNINHYIINGIWGSGKTSLLRYFRLITQEQKSAACYFLARDLSADIPDMEISTHIVQSVIRNIPYKLNQKKSRFFRILNGFGIQILGSGFNISFAVDKNKLVDPQIFLLESILNIWQDIAKYTNLLVLLIDDVQNYSKVPRLFTTLKNVLSDREIIHKTRILCVLSSTVDGWRPFIEANHPIGRFFMPRMELNNFDKIDSIKLVNAVLKRTGVVFGDSVKDKMFRYTDGHLFQLHALGGALYDNQKSGKVTDREWEKGFEQALFSLGNIVYEGVVANISPSEIKVLKGLKLFGSNKIKEIKHRIKLRGVNEYLRRLVEKKILKTPGRGEYVVRDKMLWEYLKRK